MPRLETLSDTVIKLVLSVTALITPSDLCHALVLKMITYNLSWFSNKPFSANQCLTATKQLFKLIVVLVLTNFQWPVNDCYTQ